MRRFLYWWILKFYHLVGWFVRKLRPKQKEKIKQEKVLSVKELLHNSYEPKRKFRWLFGIEGFPAFVMKTAERPFWNLEEKQSFVNVTIYDPILPSMSHEVWKWCKDKTTKNGVLKLLDQVGDVIEEWKFTGLKPNQVSFGKVDYSKSDACEIDMRLQYSDVELVF